MRRKRAEGSPNRSPNPEDPSGQPDDILRFPHPRIIGRSAIAAPEVLDALVTDTLSNIERTLRAVDPRAHHPPDDNPPEIVYLDAA